MCVCVSACAQRHSCGIVSRPAGRHRDNTNTHTVLLLSLYFTLPMTPLFPSLSSPFSPKVPIPPAIRFSTLVSSSSLVDLCGAQPVVSGGTVIKKNKGIALKWVFDQESWHAAGGGQSKDISFGFLLTDNKKSGQWTFVCNIYHGFFFFCFFV